MADHLTTTSESLAAQAAVGEATFTASGGSMKIRFHSADPTETGSANEISAGGGYSTGGIAVTPVATLTGLVASLGAFTLSNAPAAVITHWSLWDGTTTYCYGTYSKTLSATKDYEWNSGDFTFTFSGDWTEFFAQKVWDAIRGNASYINTTPKLIAFTASPGTTGAVSNEAANASYARPTATWGAESGGAISISANAEYGTAYVTASENITHLGVVDENETPDKITFFDTPTGGTITVNVGETLRSKASEFTVTAS